MICSKINILCVIVPIRLASMTLAPLENRPKPITKKTSVTWNERQLAVTTLINEASALIDIFNEVSMMLGPEMNLNKFTTNEADQTHIPKSKWEPILKLSCDDLKNSLKSYRPRKHLSSAQLLASPK